MDDHSPKYKLKAGLKMVTAGMYDFYIQIEGLSMEELRKYKANYKHLIRRKNKKGIRVKIDLALLEKVHGKLSPIKQPIKKGQLEIKADNHRNFSVCFNMKITRRSVKKEGDLYKVKLKHSVKAYYEIDIEYHCTKEMLDELEQEYYMEQTKSNNRAMIDNKVEIQKELNEMVKKEKGITNTSKSSFKKCINCYYYEKGKCGLFGITVKKNEVCKRFYAPKVRIISGGGFSPK